MEATEIAFIQSTKRVGLGRAQEILSLLIAYDSGTQTVKVIGKKEAAKAFNEAFEPMTRKLTKAEEKRLDADLKLTHERGDDHTPILASTGTVMPNMTREIISYYKSNPGHTTAQGARLLAKKHTALYADEADAFRRIRNLINTLSYAKGSQKHLEKRGGHPGWGGEAQVFAL